MNKSIPENDVILIIVYTFVAFLLMSLVLILFYYFSRKKIIQQELEKKDLIIDHQKEMLHSVILTQEEERKRIAQDLHDDISSKLNIVSLNSHLLNTPGISNEELTEIKSNIINMTGKALESARRIAHDLLPPVLEKFGLQAAIEELCQEFKSSKAVTVHFENNIVFDIADEACHLQIFRVLQELMNNSLRHGKATVINIVFHEENGIKTCEYSDNGSGFDMELLSCKKGLGMKNIQSRIEILDGNLLFNSEINKGVQVTFTFKV